MSSLDKENSGKSESVDLKNLSELIGFPKEYIKEELLLGEDKISIEELRKIAADYLTEAFTIKDTNFPQ